MKNTLFILLIFMFYGCSYSQNKTYQPDKNFTISFYNVENLYDTFDDKTLEGDDEFLPEGKLKWTKERYNKKLADLAKVFKSHNTNELPEIIGLVEVENKKVLEDLVKQKDLKQGNYQIIHEESPDYRGIDVALLYRKSEFKYLSHSMFAMIEPGDTLKTREIMYVKGIASKTDTLHIFVNHWPSRRGGEDAETRRITAAKILRTKVDSILNINPLAKIFIMGDFNDDPTNKSLNETLLATNNNKTNNNKELYNLMYDTFLKKEGTLSYSGRWNLFDNLIISQNLLNDTKGFSAKPEKAFIYRERWVMWDNPKVGELTPNRTYAGENYTGGVSDHLSVYVILTKK